MGKREDSDTACPDLREKIKSQGGWEGLRHHISTLRFEVTVFVEEAFRSFVGDMYSSRGKVEMVLIMIIVIIMTVVVLCGRGTLDRRISSHIHIHM